MSTYTQLLEKIYEVDPSVVLLRMRRDKPKSIHGFTGKYDKTHIYAYKAEPPYIEGVHYGVWLASVNLAVIDNDIPEADKIKQKEEGCDTDSILNSTYPDMISPTLHPIMAQQRQKVLEIIGCEPLASGITTSGGMHDYYHGYSGQGSWTIDEFGGDTRCDKGHIVLHGIEGAKALLRAIKARTVHNYIEFDLLTRLKGETDHTTSAKLPQWLGRGELTEIDIAGLLAQIPVTSMRDHDDWFKVMCACHYASDGKAIKEFVTWSISDPKYKDEANTIIARWNSITDEIEKPVTQGYLYVVIKRLGISAHTLPDYAKRFIRMDPKNIPEDMYIDYLNTFAKQYRRLYANYWLIFDALSIKNAQFEKPLEVRILESIAHKWASINYDTYTFHMPTLNKMFGAIDFGPRTGIFSKHRKQFTFANQTAFVAHHSNARHLIIKDGEVVKTKDGKPKTTELLKSWYMHPDRSKSTYHAVDVYPLDVEPPVGVYNVWKGLDVKPIPGDVTPILDLLKNVIMNGNEELYNWYINWCAHIFQYPVHPRAKSAVFLAGPSGTGKSYCCDLLTIALGKQLSVVDSGAPVIASSFTGPLMAKLLVAIHDVELKGRNAGHTRFMEKKIKSFIAEDRILINEKHMPQTEVLNMTRVIATSENTDSLPLKSDDRRWTVIELTNNFKTREERRKFWAPYQHNKEIYARIFLNYLLNEVEVDYDLIVNNLVTETMHTIAIESDYILEIVHRLVETGLLPFDENQKKKKQLTVVSNQAINELIAEFTLSEDIKTSMQISQSEARKSIMRYTGATVSGVYRDSEFGKPTRGLTFPDLSIARENVAKHTMKDYSKCVQNVWRHDNG